MRAGLQVEKGFGTALASICFTSYISPIVPIAGALVPCQQVIVTLQDMATCC